ncbi:MAG: 5,10-methylenetetrahydrofolate reductase, partial [Eubacterium sp.]
MNRSVPGISVPDVLIERLTAAENKIAEGIKISGEFIAQLKEEGICDGAHIMAIGAEENVPKILDVAGL